jgi:sensor histidine kinase YesM
MNAVSTSFQQLREKLMNPPVKRLLMHIGFWILWLSRTFYDIISLYGLGLGECLFMIVYAATQIPMMYFHLYVLVPQLLNRRRYILYALCTIALVFAYSNVNYALLTMIPENVSSGGLIDYIRQLNPRYDIFEGFFTLVITYSLKYAGQAVSSQNKMLQLQKDNLILELNALKSQINPHFLFNTLNNIYSLSLRKSDKTPEMILKLSDMMRYVLYECNSGAVPIEKEIQFIKNYMDLERIRHGMDVKIDFTLNGNPGANKIEPLLLIPIVENSFKHGINAQMEKGFIEIRMEVRDKKLWLQALNSVQNGKPPGSKHGIGLDNVRKRLELLYPENYRLEISPNAKWWEVNLELNLS